jgi:hypothetical protein
MSVIIYEIIVHLLVIVQNNLILAVYIPNCGVEPTVDNH